MILLLAAIAAQTVPATSSDFYGGPIMLGDLVTMGGQIASTKRDEAGDRHFEWTYFAPLQGTYLLGGPVTHFVNGRRDLAAIFLGARVVVTALPWLLAIPLRRGIFGSERQARDPRTYGTPLRCSPLVCA